jgi:hypothetical protein
MAAKEIKSEEIVKALRATAESIVQQPSVREELATPEGEREFRKVFVGFQKSQMDINGDNKVGTHELAALSLVSVAMHKDTNGNGVVEQSEARANLDRLAQRGVVPNLSPKLIDATIRSAIPEDGIATTRQEQAMVKQTEAEANALLAKPNKVVVEDISAVLNQSIDIAIKKLRAGEFPEQPDNANSEISAPRQPEGTQRPAVSSEKRQVY